MKIFALTTLFIALSSPIFTQKSLITDAILKYKKYNPQGEMEVNKKMLAGAKADIDLAAVNSETANDPYMHRYRGIIYFSLLEIATMEAQILGKQPDESLTKDYDEKIRTSFNFVLSAPKAKTDKEAVQDFINGKTGFMFNLALQMFSARSYEQAAMCFMGAYEVNKYINIENEEAKSNTILSFVRAIDTLVDQNKLDEATQLGEMVYNSMPKNIEILISLINLNLQKNDMVASEKYLNEATLIDTTNKSLFVVLGTALMELKQNEKAELAFLRALKIDPMYSESVYQYCTFMFNWSKEISSKASDLNFKDPRIPEMERQASQIMSKIPAYLDPYLEKNPVDKTALDIGWKVHYILENEEKYKELKARFEAIK